MHSYDKLFYYLVIVDGKQCACDLIKPHISSEYIKYPSKKYPWKTLNSIISLIKDGIGKISFDYFFYCDFLHLSYNLLLFNYYCFQNKSNLIHNYKINIKNDARMSF